MAPLTDGQLFGIEIATRASSIASILGSLFITSTFLYFPYFRKFNTRLIFYATWGNITTNIATFISISAIPNGPAKTTPLCEIQAFLIQWFMLADPFWVLCMALNVWRIFMIKNFDGRKLPDPEKWYILFAYGLPAITAFIYLIHDHNSGQRIMGPAILWCWVSKEFDWMRIVFFYGPMLILAGTAMSIHICVGFKVYKVKVELRKMVEESRRSSAQMSSGVLEDPFYTPKDTIVVTTKIERDIHAGDFMSRPATPGANQSWLTPPPSPRKSTTPPPTDASDTTRSPTPCCPSKSPGRYSLLVPLNPNSPHRHSKPLLIGRYRATAYSAPLASGDFATLPSPQVPVFQPTEHAAHLKRRRENAAAFAYFRVALLLFVALVVVWVPSSINRLYQIAHPDHPSYGLNVVSALVLPMQGFWNAVIYAQTTWPECKRAYATGMSKLKGDAVSKQPSNDSVRDESIKYNGIIESEGTEMSFEDKSELNASVQTV
ncbi:hypothetical protein BU25DRAFT_79576 [Macroventuria anomochaeta]|uniref:Uncharacterized protein n=1 Tax=Macroventuria anomochaeta TaxID=301207 RepID=A0ACB6SF76_9PLEO|nr:uncharacterized protein BU25DRAFT_79576 [Macroventuria anomochaeta]KAF2632643.1 hypothetical protein BU25DRAFT_79576 [Macroventuria anomochaeta]